MSVPYFAGRGLIKRYAGVTVVDSVSVEVAKGEIRAVIGENGAGKSTLMNMLSGVIRPDGGEIEVDGVRVHLDSPRDATRRGIAIVHQEIQLVPQLSVVDNLMLVRPPSARGMRRRSRTERDLARMMLARVGLHVDPDQPADSLSVAQCQLLEIAKALALDARVLVFDEPTAALEISEVDSLLKLISQLRDEGKAILYISHALDEILRLANTIAVLRDGRQVADFQAANVSRDILVKTMVDRAVGLYDYALPAVGSKVMLEAKALATASVNGVSLEVRAGEILGFAGLMGCGMEEAVRALCGASKLTAGSVSLDGVPQRLRSPRDAAAAGIVMVPEERKRDGIVPDRSVCENMHLGRYAIHSQCGFVRAARLQEATAELVRRLDVRLHSLDQPIATLSGGNQQKVLLARCIQGKPRVLIIASPTRGVDIGAKEAIHKIIIDIAAQGTAVIVMSPELEEVLALAHRVAVFSQERMVAVLPRSEASPSRIMQLAIGGSRQLNVA